MKTKIVLLFSIIALAFGLTGCVSGDVKGIEKAAQSAAQTAPKKSAFTSQVETTRDSVQATVNHEVIWLWVAGALCLIAAAALIYAGQLWPGIKVGVAGILLPIGGTILALHWLLFLSMGLLAAAVFVIYERYKNLPPGSFVADVSSFFAEIENVFHTVESKLTPTAPAAAPAAATAAAAWKPAAATAKPAATAPAAPAAAS